LIHFLRKKNWFRGLIGKKEFNRQERKIGTDNERKMEVVVIIWVISRRQDIQHNNIQHNTTQHEGFIGDTQQKMTLIIITFIIECHYAECRTLLFVMQGVVTLNVVMLSVVGANRKTIAPHMWRSALLT
jgi:hypothetical protein